MGQPVIQTSFNAGEWAPALNARVDLAKYHSGAALLRNFFVDYRGGATTRPGSKYVIQTLTTTAGATRIIPFQASIDVAYILEFGNGYVRFTNKGAPITGASTGINNISQSSPTTVTSVGHPFTSGDWVVIANAGGMTPINGSFYQVINPTSNTFQLSQLYNSGAPVDSTNYPGFTGGGTISRIYSIGSPYLSSELAQLKFVQQVNQLIITHPNHPPYVLTLISANNWTLLPINFVPSIGQPSGVGVASTANAGSQAVAYLVTAVDINGQESVPSVPATLVSRNLLGQVWSNSITFGTVTNATSYNVYRTQISTFNAIASGSQYGFVGNCTGTTFVDTNTIPNFAITPPIVQNPFAGSGVTAISLTAAGFGYTSVPTVTLGAPPVGGTQATALATCSALNNNTSIANGGGGYQVGDQLTGPGNMIIQVTALAPPNAVAAIAQINNGSVNFPSGLPTSNIAFTGGHGNGATFNVVWGVSAVILTNPGTGYISAPAVTFSTAGSSVSAAATATIGAPSSGNPTVPGFVQQRLVLAGPVLSPAQLNLSQPGSPFNYNISQPVQPDDAIQATLSSTVLNNIKSLTTVAAGMLVLTDRNAWVINGGSFGAPISATSVVANPQNYAGSNDLPPIVTPNDILYMKSQGSTIVDLTYNFYLSSYTGTDISILSSHLFQGFTFSQWTWAEEPFKLAWLVRTDGVLLSLSFVKEQELIAWAHHDTTGNYNSIASVIENTSIGYVSAVYTIVQRTVNGASVPYIERFVELTYPNDYKSSWQVDAGIGYNGAPATTFYGAQHLGGLACTGLADGVVINFTMPTSGSFVFGPGGTAGLTGIANASIVTVGLAFLPQLQTLRLDLGEPTVQGKRKKIAAVTARVKSALGLSIGNTFSTLVAMKDLVIGNVGTMSNQTVTGLVTEDARTVIDTNWTVQGQVAFQQNNPYPASILGVIPEIEVGDTAK